MGGAGSKPKGNEIDNASRERDDPVETKPSWTKANVKEEDKEKRKEFEEGKYTKAEKIAVQNKKIAREKNKSTPEIGQTWEHYDKVSLYSLYKNVYLFTTLTYHSYSLLFLT